MHVEERVMNYLPVQQWGVRQEKGKKRHLESVNFLTISCHFFLTKKCRGTFGQLAGHMQASAQFYKKLLKSKSKSPQICIYEIFGDMNVINLSETEINFICN